MKSLSLFLTLAMLSFGMAAMDADAARRFGGGGSIGKQRQSMDQQAAPKSPSQSSAAAPAQGAGAAAAGGSKWGGALAGLAAGGLLAALFMGGAFDGIKMMDVLMLAALLGAAFFVFRMLRKPQQAAAAPRPMQYAGTAPVDYAAGQNAGTGSGAASLHAAANIPADFDVAPFLRNAKTSFIRLQAANDAKDLNDIREYTTPEMFAEISMQIGERGSDAQKTEVVTIHADLLEVIYEEDLAIASVRFNGELRDALTGTREAFDEIWHVQKNLKDDRSVWLLAGIQQIA